MVVISSNRQEQVLYKRKRSGIRRCGKYPFRCSYVLHSFGFVSSEANSQLGHYLYLSAFSYGEPAVVAECK